MVPADDRWVDPLERFLEGRYWTALKEFERLRRGTAGDERRWFQGWVLLAAALFHRDRGNARGASACLDRAERLWAPLAGRCVDRDPAGTLEAVRRVLGQEWARPRLVSRAEEAEAEPEIGEEDWSEST